MLAFNLASIHTSKGFGLQISLFLFTVDFANQNCLAIQICCELCTYIFPKSDCIISHTLRSLQRIKYICTKSSPPPKCEELQ